MSGRWAVPLVVLALAACGGQTTGAPATAPATATAAPSPASPDVTPFGGTRAYPDGVAVEVTGARRFVVSPTASGAPVGRPAVAVTVRITNGSAAPLDLGSTFVTVLAGADGVQADEVFDRPEVGIGGFETGTVVAPGRSATAAYGFAVADAADLARLSVAVEPDGGYEPALFEGAPR